MISKTKKKNPLSKAQNHLLKSSLKRLLGEGLIREQEPNVTEKEKLELKKALLKNALEILE